jgi:hypothetical protein
VHLRLASGRAGAAAAALRDAGRGEEVGCRRGFGVSRTRAPPVAVLRKSNTEIRSILVTRRSGLCCPPSTTAPDLRTRQPGH